MSGLGPEFEDVLSESSAESDDLPELEEEGDEPEVDAASDDEGAEPDTDDKSGRTLNNVRREVLRKTDEKFSKLERTMQSSLESLRNEIRSAVAPGQPNVPSLDSHSIEYLRAQRKDVPEEKREAFDQYLFDRTIREATESTVNSVLSKNQEKETRKEAARQAMRKFPELRQAGSEFKRTVEARMNERGADYVRNNPWAVLDIARDVADSMGVPSSRKRQVPEDQLSTRSNQRRPAPKKGDDDLTALMPTKEEVERVAKRLQHALPGKKFDTEAIRKRIAEYRANQHHLSQRIRVSSVKE